MSITPDQLRAARALLNISQDDLARGSGVAVTSIRQFELGTTTNLQQKTEGALLDFLSEKIEFICARGVALRETKQRVLEGETVVAQLFEDIRATLRGKENAEALFLYGDIADALQPKTADYCTVTHKSSFTYRAICHKNSETAFARMFPTDHPLLPFQVIYGGTVAQMIGSDQILLIRSPMLAKGVKQSFEMLWSVLPPCESEEETSAHTSKLIA